MLCDRLKETRKKSGLTQQQVRDKIGVSQAAYGYFETGERQPSVAVLKKIALLFGVSTDYLLEIKTVEKK